MSRLVVVGDIMIQTPTEFIHRENDPLLTILREAEVTLANLEVPLTDKGYPSDKMVAIRANPELCPEVIDMGVNLVAIANNHALDFGREGFLDFMDVLKVNDLPFVGGGQNLQESLRHQIIRLTDGLRIACLSFSSNLPTGSAALNDRPGVAPVHVYAHFVIDPVRISENPGVPPYVETQALEADQERIVEAIKTARKEADLVFVMPHWGVTHGWIPSFQSVYATYQQPLGHSLIDAGADAVFGNHPHIIHGIEMYKGKPIVYSFGNFVFHLTAHGKSVSLSKTYPPYNLKAIASSKAKQCYVFVCDLRSGEGLHNIRLIPIQLNSKGEPAVATGEQVSEIFEDIIAHSQEFGTHFSVSTDFEGIPALLVDPSASSI